MTTDIAAIEARRECWLKSQNHDEGVALSNQLLDLDIPALLARVRELEGENEELRKVADAMHAELQEDVKYIRELHREAADGKL